MKTTQVTQKVSVVDMTPEWAEKLLEHNKSNRPIRKRFITFLIDEAKNGRWQLTTAAIGTDTNGNVVNGQHRLYAIVQSGLTLPVILITGLTEESFMVTDRGISRSIGDVLRISPALAADATIIAAVLGQVIGHRVSPSVIKQVITWWAPTYDDLLIHPTSKSKRIANAATRVGIGTRLVEQTDPAMREYILTQYQAMMDGDPTHMSRATAGLWRRLLTDKLGGDRSDRLRGMALVYQSFNPKKRDLEPRIFNHDSVLADIRSSLNQLARAQPVLTPKKPRQSPLGEKARAKHSLGKAVTSHVDAPPA